MSKVSVKYSGPFSESSGYSNANRNIVAALVEADVDVVTEFQFYANQRTDYGKQFEIVRERREKHHNYPIKVLHITPNVYQKYKEVGKYHIGHLFWETTKMGHNWEWYLHEVRELWTGCEYNIKCFREAGFEGHIFKFPQPVATERTETALPIQNAAGYIFYSIFQWTQRKDPRSLLESYWKEFQNDENVTLVLKTYGLSFDEHQRNIIFTSIKKWKEETGFRKFPRTLIIDYLLSDSEIHSLHEAGDCFVSAHRGEGWGVPQAEALAHGKPVISTNLGGIHEWVPDDAMLKVNYSLCEVFDMEEHEAYTCLGNLWGQVAVNDLRAKMRFVYEKQEEAKQIGERGRKFAQENLNFKRVGELMQQRLVEIYKEQKL